MLPRREGRGTLPRSRPRTSTPSNRFAVLDGRWAAEGRTHAGIVLVTTSAFPQDRNFIGSVVNALHGAAAEEALPAPGHTLYLRPAR